MPVGRYQLDLNFSANRPSALTRPLHTSPKGVLACLDGYMNIAMEQTEEYVNGQLKAKYGDCFIRGNNGKKEGEGDRGREQNAESRDEPEREKKIARRGQTNQGRG